MRGVEERCVRTQPTTIARVHPSDRGGGRQTGKAGERGCGAHLT